MKEVIQEAVKLVGENQPCVLATVVRTKGSTPQKAGAKLLVRKDGSGVGTLGGGCVEGDIWFAAKEILRRHGAPEFRDYLLNEDIAARDGLVCGGTMYFFIEPLWEPHEFLPFGEVQVSPAAAFMSYGIGVFEGLKAQRTADGRTVFQTSEQRSTRELSGARGGWGHQALVPLKDIAPGAYVLRVEARSRLSGVEPVVRETQVNVR